MQIILRIVLGTLVAVLIFFLGEIPIAFYAYCSKEIVESWTDWSLEKRFLLEWAISIVAVSLTNYVLCGLPLIVGYENARARRENRADLARPDQISTNYLGWKLLEFGKSNRIFKSLCFFTAALIGGSFIVAWWYASHNLPKARSRALLAAFILGSYTPLTWLALFNPEYQKWGLVAIAFLCLTAVAVYIWISSQRSLTSGLLYKPNFWLLLGFLYNGLFAVRPHRDLVKNIASRVVLDKPVLDAGCGTGKLAQYMTSSNNLFGIDLSSSMLKRAARRYGGGVRLGDITNLPYESNCFAQVVSINLLYAVGNQSLALSEMARVLQPGGELILVTPITPSLFPLILEHFKIAGFADNLLFIANIPRIMVWILIISLPSLINGSKFTIHSEAEIIQIIKKSGLNLISVVPCYAGIDRCFTARKPVS